MKRAVTVSPVERAASADTSDRVTVVDESGPLVSARDLGLTRGDGIFEVIGVVNGRPQAFAAHLRRLAWSAGMLDLPPIDLGAVELAVRKVIEVNDPAPEMGVKVVVTRGIEGASNPTMNCFVTVIDTAGFERERIEGIEIVTLDRGYPHDIAARAPWLLAGAKTLSYASNKAVLREAARRGADDVLFVSSDGYLLEGPSSTLLIRIGNHILTPATAQGVLPGTTQGSLFEFFADQGYVTSQALLRAPELAAADAAWLASSVRLLAPIRAVDGVAHVVDNDLTRSANEFLLARAD